MSFLRRYVSLKPRRFGIAPSRKQRRRFKESDGAVRTMRDGREICLANRAGMQQYKQRTLAMAARQEWICGICKDAKRPMTLRDVTFEHSDLRGLGGARRDDRIEIDGRPINCAAHFDCNARKGSKRTNSGDAHDNQESGTTGNLG